MLSKAEVIDGLFTLSVEDRLEVRALLNDELEGVEPAEFSLSKEWREEISRRIAEYRRGDIQGIPAEEVRAEIEARIAERRASAHAS